MIDQIHAQLDAIRLGVHRQRLHHRERRALARLGRVTLGDGGSREGRLATLAADAAKTRCYVDALEQERRTALAATRADLGAGPRWMAPVALVRGASAQVALRRRRAAAEQALKELHLTAGRLAMTNASNPAAREVQAVRAQMAALQAKPLPAWADRARSEAKHLQGAIWSQLRAQLTPKAPALAGMAMGWWITSRYTDSHARSILRSIGIGHGGTHVVSGSTYKAMQFGLPLLAAAVCAYVGERIALAVRERRAEG
jgi:hypothetical protein